ncbi:MAG: sialidase family protein, partial [Dehalococcoidia bacterium]
VGHPALDAPPPPPANSPSSAPSVTPANQLRRLMSRRPHPRLWPLLLGLVLLTTVHPNGSIAVRAQSAAAVVSDPVRVSGPTPFAPGCEGRPQTSRVYPGSAVETNLAVDPSDPQHLVAVWQQDRFAGGASRGLVSAFSHDGGATWTESMAPFSHCAGGNTANGGDYERASDPWVSIDSNGDIYESSLSTTAPESPNAVTAILVSKSTDGGATWGAAATLIRDQEPNGFNDKESITADPTAAGYVYAIWDRLFVTAQGTDTSGGDAAPASGAAGSEVAPTGVSAPIMFARTTDGGATWEAARPIYSPSGGATGNLLVVLPTGELVDLFTRIANGRNVSRGQAPVQEIGVIRSTDRGQTWSAPVIVSSVVGGLGLSFLEDPYSGQPIRSGGILPSIAVERQSGRLYAGWTAAAFPQSPTSDRPNGPGIAFSSSADGGQTWSAPIRVNRTPAAAGAFTPTIAVLDNGSVGVSYYDLRKNTPTQDAILTDYWLDICRADCTNFANWSEAHIAGSFDLQRAAFSGGFFLGDYQGLRATGSRFLLLYGVAAQAADGNYSDVDFTSVTLP